MAYEKSLVTFIDVLGFRDLVKADRTGSSVLDVSQRLRTYGTEDLLGQGKARKALYVHFSDSVVRVTPLVGDENWKSDKSALLHELESLTYIQGELAAAGVLLRGGIAAGLVHGDETGVFGPAFLDAYSVESQLALYPRIVLHPALLAEHGTCGERGSAIYADDGLAMTRSGSDGLHFVDYLRNFPREVHTDPLPERGETAKSYMIPRKALIESELTKRAALDPVRVKYAWLGRYHNEVVSELLREEADHLMVKC